MRQSHIVKAARHLPESSRSSHTPVAARSAGVHPALLWAPFALALVGLFFQSSVGIAEFNRLTKEGTPPALLDAFRPVLMQVLCYSWVRA
jgi:hypothetical protein